MTTMEMTSTSLTITPGGFSSLKRFLRESPSGQIGVSAGRTMRLGDGFYQGSLGDIRFIGWIYNPGILAPAVNALTTTPTIQLSYPAYTAPYTAFTPVTSKCATE